MEKPTLSFDDFSHFSTHFGKFPENSTVQVLSPEIRKREIHSRFLGFTGILLVFFSLTSDDFVYLKIVIKVLAYKEAV